MLLSNAIHSLRLIEAIEQLAIDSQLCGGEFVIESYCCYCMGCCTAPYITVHCPTQAELGSVETKCIVLCSSRQSEV